MFCEDNILTTAYCQSHLNELYQFGCRGDGYYVSCEKYSGNITVIKQSL